MDNVFGPVYLDPRVPPKVLPCLPGKRGQPNCRRLQRVFLEALRHRQRQRDCAEPTISLKAAAQD